MKTVDLYNMLKKRLNIVIFVVVIFFSVVLLLLNVDKLMRVYFLATMWIVYTIFLGIKYNKRLEYYFLCTALICGLAYSIFFPPFSIADERTHFMTEYNWANKIMGISSVEQKEDARGIKGVTYTNTYIREVDKYLFELSNDYSVQMVDRLDYRDLFCDSTEMIERDILIAKYAPFPAYFVGSIAIIIGRLLHLAPLWLVMLVRFANLITYILLCYYAIKIVPFAKLMFFTLCTIPLVIQQGMSCSYDSILFAMVFFYIAYVFYLAKTDEIITRWKSAGLFATSILLAPMKGCFILLVFLVFLIPSSQFKTQKRYVFSLMSTVVLGMVVWFMYNVGTNNIKDLINPDIQRRVVEYAGEEGIYISSILKNPLKYFVIIIKTINLRGLSLTGSMTGTVYRMGALIELGYFALFLLSTLKGKEEKFFNFKEKIFILVIYFASYCLLSVLTMLSYQGSGIVIADLQPRYLTPFLPLLGVLLKNDVVVVNKNIDKFMIITVNCIHNIFFLITYFQFTTI